MFPKLERLITAKDVAKRNINLDHGHNRCGNCGYKSQDGQVRFYVICDGDTAIPCCNDACASKLKEVFESDDETQDKWLEWHKDLVCGRIKP